MDKNKQKIEKIKADIATLKKNKDKPRWLFAVIFILISFSTFQYSIRESQAKNQQANNKATFNLTADEYLMLGKCMGYIQYQVNRKINVHESHVKFYNKYIGHVGPLMQIAAQYPSCSKPGINIKGCLRNNGVNDKIINLVIGVNTGGEAHKDPTTKALMSAACMEL